ncbi:2-oxo acid dehydrogenase subunit E2 [bacterium]|nr:2-oxo acid dehydrogenase subunit E2 [bacterium]
MFEFKLPDLGEGIAEGELLKWYVDEGGTIAEDADLMDVETDKAAVTIPSPVAGKVVKLNGKVGDILNVGDVVVVIDNGSGGAVASAPEPAKTEEAAPSAQPAAATQAAPAQPAAAPAAAQAPADRKPGRPVPAAPATRRVARELGLDINIVPGTGPGGRVTQEDVQAFAKGGAPSAADAAASDTSQAAAERVEFGETGGIPFYELETLPDFDAEGPVEREQIRSIRRKVAKKVVSSMILVPHVAHMDEADVTELEAFRAKERKRREGTPGGKLTLMPFVMRALASLLKKYPQFNASLDPHRNEIVYKKYYNIGFAADTPRGLMVPVVKDVDRKSILQVGSEISELAGQARDGSIEAGNLRHGTITITNVGPIGGTGLIPTINYPEVAILGMGRTQEKPVVRNGEIVIRKMLPLTLAFDHRVADGAQAAYMVTELVHLLSDPNQLLLEA